MKTILLSAVVLSSMMAMADSKWAGTGEVFTPDGTKTGSYKIEIQNTDTAPNTVLSLTTITLQDGSQKVSKQSIARNGNNWTVDSDFGTGGGSCYGQDLCENYIKNDQGAAVATTIIVDNDLSRRDITTYLQNGKAVKIYKDNLVKMQ